MAAGSRRRRSQRIRVASYLLAGLVALALVLLVDWRTLQANFADAEIFAEQFPGIVTVAARNTVIYTVFAFLGGLAVGLGVALLRLSSIRPYRWFATIYIEVFRGLPALLTIILVGFAIPIALGVRFPTVLGLPTSGIIALALVAGAYMAETIRAGIEAVPRGQMEAARSLGMSHSRSMASIVVPQAFRIIIPPLTNELVLLLKDTALLAVLGTSTTTKELTKFARDGVNANFNGTPIVAAGLLYLVITVPLTRVVAQLEKRNRQAR